MAAAPGYASLDCSCNLHVFRDTLYKVCCGEIWSVAHPVEEGSEATHSCSRVRNSSSARGPWACPVVPLWYASMKRIAATVCGRPACMDSSVAVSDKLHPLFRHDKIEERRIELTGASIQAGFGDLGNNA